ncbi:GerAB/ArcD/ProY family transporter [Aquibacillus albus]|uniref:Spore germination protein (Amino acid permease) n=1 Tax=Aquibacillus albus TaxID=1168171 RepID=A0ABS2N2Y2_9BACI|nr:endospore germination permease [Aquibacillus albus]MBM7572495.1 spore germination protein (amino acid permease) [Aquibacillus albus]
MKKTRLKGREIIAIVLLIIGFKLADTTPAQYAQEGKNAFWLMPIVSLLVMLPSFLLLMYLLKKYKDKNLIQLIFSILGKKVGVFMGFIIFLLSYLLLILSARNYTNQITMLYFPESPTTVIMFLFLTVIFFGAKRGLQAIGTATYITLPYLKLSILVLAAAIIPKVVWLRIFPIFGDGLGTILLEGAKRGSIFFDLFILTIAYTAITSNKSFAKGIYFGGAIAFMEIIFFFLLYTTLFDYKSIDKIAFPFHDVTQYVNFGEFFTNVETFFMVFWLGAAFLRFVILIYFGSWLLGETLQLDEFEPLIFPLTLFVFPFSMIVENTITNELIFRNYLLSITTPVLIIFPIILWIVAKSKGALTK